MIAQAIHSLVSNKILLYQTLATFTTYVTLKLLFFYRQRLKRYQLIRDYGIPTPSRSETSIHDGHFHLYTHDPALFKTDVELMKRFGPYYCVFFGDEPNMIISDKDILKKIFYESSKSFKERTKLFLDTPLSHSILFAEHSRWKLLRSVMVPPFNQYSKRGDSSTEFIEESIKLMVDYINSKRGDSDKVVVDIHSLMKSTALHLISELAIKLPDIQVIENEPHVESLDEFLSVADKGLVRYAIKFPFLVGILQFLANHFEYNKTFKYTHNALDKLINDKLAASQGNSNEPRKHSQIIDTLVNLHRQGKISRTEVIGSVDAVIFAGYDTSSTTGSYLFWVVGKDMDLQNKLREELITYGIDSKYLTRVINETMRLYPTVTTFVSRMATETVEINGLTIPQGTKVVYNAWLMHRHPELWKDPEKFDPGRWEDESSIHPCAFAPFGLGERRCLGYKLALLEIRMFICDILLKFKVKTVAPDVLEIVSHAVSLTQPREKILLEFEAI